MKKMEMAMAVVRLKVMEKVARTLEYSGMKAMARLDIYGMGLQNGITVHGLSNDKPKTRRPDDCRQSTPWMHRSRSSQRAPGQEASGDGRIFISPVEAAHTIRTGEPGL